MFKKTLLKLKVQDIQNVCSWLTFCLKKKKFVCALCKQCANNVSGKQVNYLCKNENRTVLGSSLTTVCLSTSFRTKLALSWIMGLSSTVSLLPARAVWSCDILRLKAIFGPPKPAHRARLHTTPWAVLQMAHSIHGPSMSQISKFGQKIVSNLKLSQPSQFKDL